MWYPSPRCLRPLHDQGNNSSDGQSTKACADLVSSTHSGDSRGLSSGWRDRLGNGRRDRDGVADGGDRGDRSVGRRVSQGDDRSLGGDSHTIGRVCRGGVGRLGVSDSAGAVLERVSSASSSLVPGP